MTEKLLKATLNSLQFNSLLKSCFGVHHHITYMYINRHIKIHQTILNVNHKGTYSADAQADLSLRWAHTHFVGFVMSRLK